MRLFLNGVKTKGGCGRNLFTKSSGLNQSTDAAMKFLSKSLKFAALSFGCVGSLASGQSTISLQPIAPVGAAAPGAGGNWTVIAPNAYISANNTVCFEATAGAAGGGIWYGNPDALELGVLNGDVAPGGGGATFTSAGLAGIAMPFNSGAGASLLKLSDLTDGMIWGIIPW